MTTPQSTRDAAKARDVVPGPLVTRTVLRAGCGEPWDAVFEERPDVARIELESWEGASGTESDLVVFYRDSEEPFSYSSLREGTLKVMLGHAWTQFAPEVPRTNW